MTSYADHQLKIYLEGAAGKKPALPMCLDALEALARERLAAGPYGYVAGSAGREETAAANRQAFARWRIVPRMLRDVEQRDLSVEIFGRRLPAPVLVAPVGVQSVVHAEAELATARGARSVGVPFVLSTVSSKPLERVAEEAGDLPRWFQLYFPKDRELAASLVGRAEKAGFEAVVVTLDTALLGWRERDLGEAYLPFLAGEGLASYFSDPVFRAALEAPPEQDPRAAIERWASLFGNPALSWDDLAFLRERTSLPILLKGILHPDDAHEARERGMDGVIVSNHGGRQVDGALPALEALPRVVEAVGDWPVLLDSGVRSGADGIKALALGARAVLLGRPVMWGLAVAGADGVAHVLRNFLAELDLTLALSGHRRVAELSPGCLDRAG